MRSIFSKTVAFLYLIVVISFVFKSQAQTVNSSVNIIPKPQKVLYIPGNFEINKKTILVCSDDSSIKTVGVLQSYIKNNYNLDLKIYNNYTIADIEKNLIYFETDKYMDEESYTIKIEPAKIICKASSDAGFFYAIQSLIQSIEQKKKKVSIACMFIEDKPLYSWRGYMLDVSRHFFDKETVKQYLDVMARLKLNRFHWHLTDEQAWRIEIKKYPNLTEIGAIGSWDDRNAPKAFYTQEDIREIVQYAADRHIMVIPEIDMPGHASAASRAYPEISGGGEGRWEGFTYHPAKQTTYEFIDNVMTEIAELFPAPYIHIGADEVHFGNQSWFTDPVIQKFIKDNSLKDEAGLEHYFIKRACEIVKSKGKKMIGWDEITNTGLTPDDAIVMWWRHDKTDVLTLALDKGFDVILTPRIPCYFDFVQDDSHKIGRRWAGDFNELHTVYNFPSNIENIISEHSHQIRGMQANVWTERIKDKQRLDYMTFPRLLAIAEDAWTNEKQKDYLDFESRVKVFMEYLKTLKINFFNIFDKSSSPEPWGPDKQDVIAEG